MLPREVFPVSEPQDSGPAGPATWPGRDREGELPEEVAICALGTDLAKVGEEVFDHPW